MTKRSSSRTAKGIEENPAIGEGLDLQDQENQKVSSFAVGMGFYKLFWVFFIGCFLGVILEMVWCVLKNHVVESRTGLIYGPFNLVYGIGALVITVALHWLAKKSDLWIFVGGAVIGAAFEYLCSCVQEMMFGTVSWEYSAMLFNLNGRINLLYSVFWGILALLWVKVLYPRMSDLIEKIPNKVGRPLTWFLLVFMVFNTVMSGLAVYRMSQRYEGIPAHGPVAEYFDRHYPDERMDIIYPNMNFVDKP